MMKKVALGAAAVAVVAVALTSMGCPGMGGPRYELGASGMTGDNGGVVVTEVEPYGPAARAGLEVGDVITDCNGVILDGLDELCDRIGESTGTVQLTVWKPRLNTSVTVNVALMLVK